MHFASTVQVILGTVLGLGVGAAFFSALRENTRLYGTNVGAAVALHFARFALTTGALVALAVFMPQGLLPALGAFTVVGLVMGRRAAQASTP